MDLFSNMSNTQAVARLKEGDEAVFTQLYESASRMVYFQARKILEDDEAALKKRQAILTSPELLPEEDAMFDDRPAPGETPEELAEAEATSRILGELVDTLPEPQRVAVMLYYYDQCTVAQIAEITNCSQGTVKSRLNYARKALEGKIRETEQSQCIRLHSFSPALLFIAFSLQEQGMLFSPEQVRQSFEGICSALGLSAAALSAGAAAGGAAAGMTTTAATATTTATAATTAAPIRILFILCSLTVSRKRSETIENVLSF